MSATKFNGFEKYFIQTALKHAIEEAYYKQTTYKNR